MRRAGRDAGFRKAPPPRCGCGGGTLSIERTVVLDRWWFEAGSIAELRRLAEAEDRVADDAFQLACFGTP